MPPSKQDLRQTHAKIKPNWDFEAKIGHDLIAGVDEAGRGPLAGPVVAAAVILDRNLIPPGLNDSKKLTDRKRDVLFKMIYETAQIGVGIAEPEEIDRINILAATMCAMQRAVADLPQTPQAVLIDGNRAPTLPMTCQAIVKGDAKSLSIAAASIIAKTTRDRLMIAADTRFSGYGHAGHKGYPTKAHRQTLLTTGASPIHRRSFGPVRDVTGKPINLP